MPNLKKITVFFSLALSAALQVSDAFAHANGSDPQYLRALERQTKARQARALKRQVVVQDLIERPGVSVESYAFDLHLMPAESRLKGMLTVELVATSPIEVVTLDAAGLHIFKSWMTDRSGLKSEVAFEKSSSSVSVRLPTLVQEGTRFALTFAYSAAGDKRDGRATDIDRGLFFVNADGSRRDITPTIYTSAEPALAHTWFPCIDDPSMKAKRVSMRVTAPSGWFVVSNGALKGVTEYPETKTTTFEWEESFPIPTYLISLAAAPYTVIEDRHGGLPVQYFVPKHLEEKARIDFKRTPQMLEYFSKLWVPYPFEKYAMAAVPMYHGAMEHTSATTVSDAHINGDLESEDTVAHELAHQWWGDLVTPSDWDHLWLSEGFATYAEVLFAERFRGADAALESLLWDRSSYFRFDADGVASCVDPKIPADEKFSPAVYEKGAWVVHMLRHKLGDSAFFAGLSEYLNKHAFKNTSTEDLKASLEAASGVSLTEFFDQWVYGSGYPVLKASWSYDKTKRMIEVTMHQAGERVFHFHLDALVAARKSSGELVAVPFHLELNAEKHVFTLPIPPEFPEPQGLTLDPGLRVLKKAEVARSAEELRFWLDTASLDSHDVSTLPQGAALWVARLEAIEGFRPSERTPELALELASRVKSEAAAPVRAAIFDTLAAMNGANAEQVRAAIRDGLTDESIDVRIAAAGAAEKTISVSPDLASLLAEQFEREPALRVRAKLAQALAVSRHPRAFGLLYAELQRGSIVAANRKVLQSILGAFGKLGDRRAAQVLTDFVNGHDPYLIPVALESLGSLSVPETFDKIVDILADRGRAVDVRVAAAVALANFGGISAARALRTQHDIEKDDAVKSAIKIAIERLGGTPGRGEPEVTGSPALLRW